MIKKKNDRNGLESEGADGKVNIKELNDWFEHPDWDEQAAGADVDVQKLLEKIDGECDKIMDDDGI